MAVVATHGPNEWVVMIATGPSLSVEQRDVIRRYRSAVTLFGVNDAYRLFEDLDYLYACDPEWWDKHAAEVAKLQHPVEKWTQDEVAARNHRLNFIQGDFVDGLSRNPNRIHYGTNGGFQALNLAYLKGFRQFILIGYSMQFAPNGASHFFGEHPTGLRRCTNYNVMADCFKHISCERLGIKIFNCTPDTFLKHFPRRDLEETLRDLERL